jgi:prepilin-type N-terminal cleavage/methylation domain-containing protein
MNMFDKKYGYTLSEVLISITLIGFLATMTLSTVGSSVQQRTRLAQFRAAYSKMSTALKNITIEKARIYSCYYAPTDADKKDFGLNIEIHAGANSNFAGCTDLESTFVRAMGAVRFCENNAITEGCVPANFPKATSGCFQDYNNSKSYVFDNSMILITNNKSDSMRLFALDVNGRKGPNKWGQDIFPFSVKYTETKNVQGKPFVKAIGILPPDEASCKYVDTSVERKKRASRLTSEMMKESAGIRLAN